MITIFELTGSDVIEFLNNQVVTELKSETDASQYTVICNPKGRIVFSLFISTNKNHTYIAVDSKLSDNFLQYVNLRRFRMAVDIQVSDAKLFFANNENNLLVHISTKNNENEDPMKKEEFWLNMFKLGLPWVTSETTELFIPQHLNLDKSKIIDFEKGCYPGQEVVARLHFLGKVKKRMKLISYERETPYKPGETVILDENESKAEICSTSIFQENKWRVQAIIPNN